MGATPTQNAWSSEALFSKALLYVAETEQYTANDWQFAFWSSLSLELLARAAVAHISPTLLADSKDWHNVYHALGGAPTTKEFVAKSVSTTNVMSMLKELVPNFTEELCGFCKAHGDRRNAELHSGEGTFLDLRTSQWLAKYYASCKVLLRFMGKNLDGFVHDAAAAENMIESLKDTAAKAVNKVILLHKEDWDSKGAPDRQILSLRAAALATSDAGHKANCPACGNQGLLYGSGQGPVTTEVRDDVIIQRQTMLPSRFECSACNLTINGFSKLSACGLGDAFTATYSYSPAKFFELHTREDLEEAVAEALQPDEPDFFNE